jgi:hypothetical protein
MNLSIWKRFVLTTIFAEAIVALTTTVLIISIAARISVTPPGYAQADNMTGDENMTEGNMTAPGIAGSGQALYHLYFPESNQTM